jgi:chromosomal replication initiator protein
MSKTFIEVWDNSLKFIRDNVSPQSFKTWFEPIKPLKLESGVLTIQVPTQFFYEWLEEHYISLLKSAIRKELGPEGKLVYSIIMDNSAASSKQPYSTRIPATDKKAVLNPSVNAPIDLGSKTIRNPFVIPGLKKINIDSNLNPFHTFENFIEGDCNRLARSAGYAVSKSPGGTSFNPLLIYGGTGLGKTHLANAIGVQIKKNFPNQTVLYISADKFIQQFVDAVKNNSTNDFVNFYQLVDTLIMDDVQFLSGKEKTQDVFFHVFNHLHQSGKQIVLTADKPPVEIIGMEQRLLSRFKWGLSADLQAPELETRMAILQSKVYKDGIELPADVLEHLAYSITSNVRELEGALISLLAQASLNKKEITLDLARKMIDKFVKTTQKEISIEYIQKVVCDYFKLNMDIMKSKTRKREVVQARQIAMFFAKNFTKASLATIGAHCGGKDHATVLHACKTVNNLMETDKRFRSYVDELEKKINLNA